MNYFATIPPEIFPSLNTFAKLKYADILVFADNLNFSKRDQYNRIHLKSDQELSLAIHSAEQYRDVYFDRNYAWKRKLKHAIDEFYKSKPYSIFFAEDLKKIIDESNNRIVDLSQNLLFFFAKIYRFETKITLSSDIASEFNLNNLAEHFSNYHYLVEKKFEPYLSKLKIQSIRYFQQRFIEKEAMPEAIDPKTPFLDLFFSWGPYLDRLIEIA